MSGRNNAFSPGAVAAILLVGAAAFLLLLYAIGKGWTGGGSDGSGEHGASRGLNGFAGAVSLLRDTGHDVQLSRNPAGMDDYALVVLTPPMWVDPAEIQAVLDRRRYTGPTMLILPKWGTIALTSTEADKVDAESDWVRLAGATVPDWFEELDMGQNGEVATGATTGWNAFGETGALPNPGTVVALVKQPVFAFEPLVVDSEGDMLAGTYYPENDDEAWPVTVVFEPDLMNNYGMANADRAALTVELVDNAMDFDPDTPVVFDLTFAGLGESENLLTLAFRPPFLAATLCLLLAALVVAWRAFRRFGPPVAELPALAQGKTQLAHNGANLVGRLRRWHLLAAPYGALITARIAAMLGIKPHDPATSDAAIENALTRAGHADNGFAKAAHAMRNARSGPEILRAARALKSIERMLKR